MTLKEKYLDLLKDYNPDYKNTEAKGCEQIEDKFAIGFYSFVTENYTEIKGLFDLKDTPYWAFVGKTIKELLEIYKKEINKI